MLTVLKKYVNPGRGGLPHVVLSNAMLRTMDISATRDFFNGVNVGETVRGYYFADGYFIPDDQPQNTQGGKWFLLGLGVAMGGAGLGLARAMARQPRE
jgi:hypothetical protein